MSEGFWAADTAALARRVGELRAVAAAVEGVVSTLEVEAGDLGPGDISAAVSEVVGNWRDGLGEMQGKIDTIAGNVRARSRATTPWRPPPSRASRACTG